MTRMHWRKAMLSTGACALLGGAAILAAQSTERLGPPPGVAGKFFDAIPMPMPMEMDLQPITGAPYSAEAVTEVTQTLADGNRIARRVTANVARDSQGRTRRDMVLAALGPWMPAADEQPRTVFIHDPVAKVMYVLDLQRQTAMKRPLPDGERGFPPPGAMGVVTATSEGVMTASNGVVAYSARADGKGAGAAMATDIIAYRASAANGGTPPDTQTESLGTQTIEGVEATGTRTTTTIPAGQIGNELPIRIVSERWYSAELQTTLLSKRDDPRFGETVYKLTGLNRSEPAASLFEVPSGFSVTEAPDGGFRTRFKGGAPPR